VLIDRVTAASGSPPLSQLSAADRAELEREVALASALEDLPGKWQAAVLSAEAGGARSAGGCCQRSA
jgi:hypothetical protein